MFCKSYLQLVRALIYNKLTPKFLLVAVVHKIRKMPIIFIDASRNNQVFAILALAMVCSVRNFILYEFPCLNRVTLNIDNPHAVIDLSEIRLIVKISTKKYYKPLLCFFILKYRTLGISKRL